MRGKVFADAFVKAFVPPADEREMVVGGQVESQLLGERLPLGAEQDNRAGGRRAEHALNRGKDRFGLHDHPTAAAVGRVVRGVVAVLRPVADVVGMHFDELVLQGALEDGDFEIGLEDFGEEAEDVKTHRRILDDSARLGKTGRKVYL